MSTGSFGHPDGLLFPPPDQQLLANVVCSSCAWQGSMFVWPLIGVLTAGARRMEMPLGHPRDECPACGAPFLVPINTG